MSKSKTRQAAGGRAAARESTCAMVTRPIEGGAPPRMMLRCAVHGQIKYTPQAVMIKGRNIMNTGGIFPAGAVGWALMRKYFQEHREGKR